MTDIEEVRKAGERVLATLKQSKAESDRVRQVELPLLTLDDPSKRLEAVGKLHAAAHPKDLGDIYLEGIPGFEWPNMVSCLREVASRYIREHDPNAPIGRDHGFNRDELDSLIRPSWTTYLHRPPSNELARLGISMGRVFAVWNSPITRMIVKFVLLPIAVVGFALLVVASVE